MGNLRLKFIRMELGLTQKEFAEKIHMKPCTYIKKERGCVGITMEEGKVIKSVINKISDKHYSLDDIF